MNDSYALRTPDVQLFSAEPTGDFAHSSQRASALHSHVGSAIFIIDMLRLCFSVQIMSRHAIWGR